MFHYLPYRIHFFDAREIDVAIMRKIIFITVLFLLISCNIQCQDRFLVGVNTGYGFASWKEYFEYSGLANFGPTGPAEKKTSGNFFLLNVSAQYNFGKLSIGPSYTHYEFTFSSSPSLAGGGNIYKIDAGGVKGNYAINLNKNLQLSPSLDAGMFWFSSGRDKAMELKIYVVPAVELRKDLGRVMILAGVDSNFLFFNYRDVHFPPSYVQKLWGHISSVNFKVGVVVKFS